MRDLLLGLLKHPETAGWESWAVVVHEAVADEDRWLQAMLSLSLEDQFGLLEILKADASIYADALLGITARHAAQIGDEQLRDWVLTDAAQSTQRFGDRLESQREILLALTNRSPGDVASIDTALEVARLQARLFELDGTTIGTAFEQAWRLEGEVLRLEALARYLDGYDADARGRERDRLRSETDELVAVRDGLEADLEKHLSDRDTAVRDRESLERDVAALTEEHRRLREVIERLGGDITTRTGELAELTRRHDAQASEMRRLEKEAASKREQVKNESRRLDELRSSPSAQGDDRVLAKVNELYALLPADGAEADFTTKTQRGSNR